MQPILRQDGSVSCFRIEYLASTDPANWQDAGNSHSLRHKIPKSLLLTPEGRDATPFVEFSAAGDCWQETGLHGVFDRDTAFHMLQLLSVHNPGTCFRLVRHQVEQKRTVLSAMQSYKDPQSESGPAVQENHP